MKRNLLIVIALIISCYSAKLFAACPTGYVETYIQVTINGCLYNVHLCYNCTPGPSLNSSLRVFGFAPVNPNCDPNYDPNYILQSIYDNIYTPQFFSSLCQSIPPCINSEGVDITYWYEKCWMKTWIAGQMWYFPCDEGSCHCLKIVTVCYNVLTRQWDIIRTVEGFLSCNSGFDCPIPESSIPDPPQGYNSACFQLWTPCRTQ